jgi:hypothetical protein
MDKHQYVCVADLYFRTATEDQAKRLALILEEHLTLIIEELKEDPGTSGIVFADSSTAVHSREEYHAPGFGQ